MIFYFHKILKIQNLSLEKTNVNRVSCRLQWRYLTEIFKGSSKELQLS